MKVQKNIKKFRSNLKAGQALVGGWMQISNSNVVELMSHHSYDWIAFDMEHGSFSVKDLPDLFRAVELKIPTIFFCPFKARKHGKYSSICYINGRLFQAFEKIWNIHNVPIFLVNWKCADNGELINLEVSPKEKESPRVQYLGIRDYIDPLSSFLNILLGKKESKTIDGRRIYSMVINEHNTKTDKEIKKISIENYINIWADHKRNDLKYIEIIQGLEGAVVKMPSVVKIKFKSFVFKLTKI